MFEREGGPRPYTMLLVDDEPDTLDSMREMLEAETDADVQVARNAGEALSVLATKPVDLMVVDYRMPGMNGVELMAEVQKRAPGVDRVMLTAHADLGVAIRAINEGRVKRLFTKPIDPKKFLEVVEQLRGERGAHSSRTQAFARGIDTLRRDHHARRSSG